MKAVDLTGQRFGRLVVDSFAGIWLYPSGKQRRLWNCVCDCGETVVVKANELVGGHVQSCGCLNDEKRSERRFKDMSGQQIFNIEIIKRIGTKRKTATTTTPIYLCRCLLCGNLFEERADYLQAGDVKSDGCETKKKEKIIENILFQNKINYTKQTNFIGLLSDNGYPLWFDFAVWNDKDELLYVLEEQGIQHTQKSNKERDIIKKKYCFMHDIPLEEIFWYENPENKMKDIINKYLHANPVPSFDYEEGQTTISKESTWMVKFQHGSAMLQEDFLDEDIV